MRTRHQKKLLQKETRLTHRPNLITTGTRTRSRTEKPTQHTTRELRRNRRNELSAENLTKQKSKTLKEIERSDMKSNTEKKNEGDHQLRANPNRKLIEEEQVNLIDGEEANLIGREKASANQVTPMINDNQLNMEDLYSKIKSIPNYTAKLAEFLRQHNVHSTHRRIVKKKFPRRHIIVHFPYQIFMGDLIEYTQSDFKFANRGYVYILVLIDVFSKVVYVKPLKKKDKFQTSIALQSILQNLDYLPNTLITDEGLEFYNRNVRELLDRFGIHHYSIKTKMKASVVERFNRTLKTKLEKYFVTNKTKNWIDVLDEFVSNYNNTPHRTIGMAPSKVSDDNAKDVFKRMFPDIHLVAKPRLKEGDVVRVLKEKSIFEKGYTQNWSDETFQISQVKQAAGRIWYKVSTLDGILLPGIKYYWELNLVKRS